MYIFVSVGDTCPSYNRSYFIDLRALGKISGRLGFSKRCFRLANNTSSVFGPTLHRLEVTFLSPPVLMIIINLLNIITSTLTPSATNPS